MLSPRNNIDRAKKSELRKFKNYIEAEGVQRPEQETDLVCVHAGCLRQHACVSGSQIRMPNDSAVLSGVTTGTKQTSCCENAPSMAQI